MGYASTIPQRFEAGLFEARIQSTKTLSLSSPITHVSFSSHSSAKRRYYCGLRLSRMKYLRVTEKDDSLVTEELLKTDTQSHDEVENAEKPMTDLSSSGKQREASIRNVALWVSAAVAFGIALGLKEGVEKASEFFAGYIIRRTTIS